MIAQIWALTTLLPNISHLMCDYFSKFSRLITKILLLFLRFACFWEKNSCSFFALSTWCLLTGALFISTAEEYEYVTRKALLWKLSISPDILYQSSWCVFVVVVQESLTFFANTRCKKWQFDVQQERKHFYQSPRKESMYRTTSLRALSSISASPSIARRPSIRCAPSYHTNNYTATLQFFQSTRISLAWKGKILIT